MCIDLTFSMVLSDTQKRELQAKFVGFLQLLTNQQSSSVNPKERETWIQLWQDIMQPLLTHNEEQSYDEMLFIMQLCGRWYDNLQPLFGYDFFREGVLENTECIIHYDLHLIRSGFDRHNAQRFAKRLFPVFLTCSNNNLEIMHPCFVLNEGQYTCSSIYEHLLLTHYYCLSISKDRSLSCYSNIMKDSCKHLSGVVNKSEPLLSKALTSIQSFDKYKTDLSSNFVMGMQYASSRSSLSLDSKLCNANAGFSMIQIDLLTGTLNKFEYF